MQLWRGRLKLPRAFLAVVMMLTVFVSLFLPDMVAYADGEGGVTEMTLYQRASEVSREFGTALAPGSEEDENKMIKDASGNYVSPGNAGGFIGYTDVLSDDKGLVGWLTSAFTTASATITYDQLENIVDGGQDNPFFMYAGYGEALTTMGLAKSIRSNSFADIGRLAATFIMILFYLVANAAPFLFKLALNILVLLNPFKLFMGTVEGLGGADLGILSSLAEKLGDLYLTIQNFSIYALFPMLLAFTVLGALWIKGSAMKRFSRYFVRVFMLFAGLPLIGATYTGVIEELNDNMSSGADYANYLIVSSYVDFEGWARESRLAPPDTNAGRISHPRYVSGATGEQMRVANRQLVLAINAQGAKNGAAKSVMNEYGGTGSISDAFKLGNESRTDFDDESGTWTDVDGRIAFRSVFDILSRHMRTDTYSGAEYDGEVAGLIQQYLNNHSDNEEIEKEIVKMYTITASKGRLLKSGKFKDEEWASKTANWQHSQGLFFDSGATSDEDEHDHFKFPTLKYNIYNAGSLTYEGGQFTNGGYSCDTSLQPVGTSSTCVKGGLSPLAMYNFLNTSFTETGLTVFSPARSTSDTTRDAYASVTFASSGVTAATRWFENIVIMACVSSMAIAFGVMILSASVKAIPRVMSGIMGTAVGSIAFITKLLISAAVLIIQILGIMFMYMLAENIIISLLIGFDDATSTISGYFLTSGTLADFTRSFLVIVVTIVVTIFMIRNANTFRKVFEEVVSNAINRVMGLLDTSTGGKGLDVAKTTGGRIDPKTGRLSPEQEMADNRKGLIGGIAGILSDAHDIESQKEKRAEDMGQDTGSLSDKIGRRLETANELRKAKRRDGLKSLAGINGKSYEREMAAQKDSIRAMRYGDSPLGKAALDSITDDEDAYVSSSGQILDGDGNVVTDEYGNAFDKDGNPISSATPLATKFGGLGVEKSDDGALLDQDGNAYTDEEGNVFYANEEGHLVNEDGDYVALDEDGVLRRTDKPVSALAQAKKLDKMRFNADKYQKMKGKQQSSHYGMDENGNAIDKKGRQLMYEDANGEKYPVQFDADGFMVDADGNRLSVKDLRTENTGVGYIPPLDNRGFEKVVDPETGETHIRHKGDEAMKMDPNSTSGSNRPQSLSALSKQAVNAHAQALQAQQRVEQLKAQGAPEYAIRQAQRHAELAKQRAKQAQQRFEQAIESGGATLSEPVTKEQVESASRYVESQQQALEQEIQALNDLNERPVSQEIIQEQQQAVNQAQQKLDAAEKKLTMLINSGASEKKIQAQEQQVEALYQNVKQERAKLNDYKQRGSAKAVQKQQKVVQQARQNVQQQQAKLSQMQANGASQSEIAHQQQVVRQAQATQQQAERTLNNMQQAPVTKQELAQQQKRVNAQQAKVEQAQTVVQDTQTAYQTGRSYGEVHNATVRVEQAEQDFIVAQQAYDQAVQQKSPKQVIEQRQQEVERASRVLNNAQNDRQRVNYAPSGTRKQIDKAQAKFEQAQMTYNQAKAKVEQLKSSGASKQAVQRATVVLKRAKENLEIARRTKQKLNAPKGWNTHVERQPQVVEIPQVTVTESYANLVSQGVSTYDDYSQKVQSYQQEVAKQKSDLRVQQQRRQRLIATHSPQQMIDKVEAEIEQIQNNLRQSQAKLENLQENAQGLLKNGGFQPPIAVRPIRQNGAVLINQLITMGQTQSLYEKLEYQERAGTITEAGRKQKETLVRRLKYMRSDLVKAGIREDALNDKASIFDSAKHMQQSWQAFLDGKGK